MALFESERASAELVMYVCTLLVLSGPKFQKYFKALEPFYEKGATLPCGNEFKV
jgi:hypothetical protein